MAGSLRWHTYVSDDGTDWAIFADESNVEAVNGNNGVGSPPGQNYKPPANLRLRYAVYSDAAQTRNLRVPVLTQTIYNSLAPGDTIPDLIAGTGNLSFIRKRPEVISPVPTVFDTGLNDGDDDGSPPI
jgi:hypothetical protein